MRVQFSQFMSAFTALRFIRWAYTKLRELAGLESPVGLDDGGVGSDISPDAAAAELNPNGGGSVNWPIVMYMGLVVAAPYLMWKLVASVAGLEGGGDGAGGGREAVHGQSEASY